MKCANIDCDIDLTEQEISKQTFAYNKFRLCLGCRKKAKYLQYIKCAQCDTRIEYDKRNLYCKLCKRERRKEQERNRYGKGREKRDWNYEKIRDILITGDYIKLATISEETKMSSVEVHPYLNYLKTKGYNIVTYYRMEQTNK